MPPKSLTTLLANNFTLQASGYTGSRGDIGFTGSEGIGEIGYTGSIGTTGYTGSGSTDVFNPLLLTGM